MTPATILTDLSAIPWATYVLLAWGAGGWIGFVYVDGINTRNGEKLDRQRIKLFDARVAHKRLEEVHATTCAKLVEARGEFRTLEKSHTFLNGECDNLNAQGKIILAERDIARGELADMTRNHLAALKANAHLKDCALRAWRGWGAAMRKIQILQPLLSDKEAA